MNNIVKTENVLDKKGSNRIYDKFEEPMVSLFENCFSEKPIREMMTTKFLFTKKFKEQIEA
jgi:hypothetical protein